MNVNNQSHANNNRLSIGFPVAFNKDRKRTYCWILSIELPSLDKVKKEPKGEPISGATEQYLPPSFTLLQVQQHNTKAIEITTCTFTTFDISDFILLTLFLFLFHFRYA